MKMVAEAYVSLNQSLDPLIASERNERLAHTPPMSPSLETRDPRGRIALKVGLAHDQPAGLREGQPHH